MGVIIDFKQQKEKSHRKVPHTLITGKRESVVPAGDILPSVCYVLRSLQQGLQRRGYNVELPQDLEVLLDDPDYYLVGNAARTIRSIRLGTQAEMIYEMGEAIHIGWMHDYEADFDECYHGWEILYLPTALLGKEIFQWYIENLDTILPRLGFEVASNSLLVEDVRFRRQMEFIREHHLNTRDDVADFLSGSGLASCDEVPSAIIERFRTDAKLCFNVSAQVAGHHKFFIRS